MQHVVGRHQVRERKGRLAYCWWCTCGEWGEWVRGRSARRLADDGGRGHQMAMNRSAKEAA